MYKGIKLRKRRSDKMSSWFKVIMKISPCPQLATCGRLAIFICQKPTTCNRLVVVMGGVFWKGGSRELAKLTATT
jgi:hypothetical protein